jgi:hypothetical protein
VIAFADDESALFLTGTRSLLQMGSFAAGVFPRIAINAAVIARYDAVSVVV